MTSRAALATALLLIALAAAAWLLHRRSQTLDTPHGRIYTGASRRDDPYRQEMEIWLQSNTTTNGR